MKRCMLFLALGAALAAPAGAQRREFLTDGEIDQIREAQDPNQRLKLYMQFARQRIAAVEKVLAGNEPNRGQFIHEQIEEYDRIIEAADYNVDQALKKRHLFRKGLEAALKAEPEFLQALEAFRARNPKDLEEYRFILDQAIESTRDSLQGLREALGKQPKGKKEEKEEREERKQEGVRKN